MRLGQALFLPRFRFRKYNHTCRLKLGATSGCKHTAAMELEKGVVTNPLMRCKARNPNRVQSTECKPAFSPASRYPLRQAQATVHLSPPSLTHPLKVHRK